MKSVTDICFLQIKGVNKFEKYIKSNYGFYKQLNSPKTVGCFKKLRKD